MNKITEDQIEEMKILRDQGLKLREIAEKFKIHIGTVHYHINPDTKKNRIKKTVLAFKNKTLEQRRIKYQKFKEYIRNYQNNKYKTDEEYRERKKQYSRDYYRRKNGIRK